MGFIRARSGCHNRGSSRCAGRERDGTMDPRRVGEPYRLGFPFGNVFWVTTVIRGRDEVLAHTLRLADLEGGGS